MNLIIYFMVIIVSRVCSEKKNFSNKFIIFRKTLIKSKKSP